MDEENNTAAKAPMCMKRILLHEYLMGILFLQIIIRFAAKGTFDLWFFAYVGVFAVYGVLIYSGIRTMSPSFNRLRLFSNLAIMFFAYSSIKYVVPTFFGSHIYDSALTSLDKSIVGGDLSHKAQEIYSSPLTEVMSASYMSYYVVIAVTLAFFGFRKSLETFCKFCTGLFCVFAIGITCYSIVPAVGPYIYYSGTYVKQLSGFFFTRLNDMVVRMGSSRYDVFPSLHMGVSLYILIFLFFNSRKGFYIFAAPFVLLVFSTIYLRYHYFIDLLCGACLGVASYLTGKIFFDMGEKILDESQVLQVRS